MEQNNRSMISLLNISKIFKIQAQTSNTVFETFANLQNKKSAKKFHALDNIDLEVKQGEMIGIIGRNGSGKSTLLKIISGVLDPTDGKISINGKLVPLLALGSGFNPELSAKENIIFYGMLLGATKKYILKKINEIIQFAELEKYLDVKVKHFSSGMYLRLAFSVAVFLDPDIILVDEVLSVGDESFQKKSFDKLMSFKKSGKTIILVTHSLELVENFCDRAAYLDKGKILAIGNPQDVVKSYRESFL
jgi:ABC-type polysaccharide/polyol phosphate transport system ATPase subunit